MTVEELIERLSKEPKWAKVLVGVRNQTMSPSHDAATALRDIDGVMYDHHLNVVLDVTA